MYGNSAPFSYSPRGFSQEDLPQLRRPLQQDEPRAALLQSNSMSRPSGKSIYLQRKEYSETLNKHTDEFHVRVEHLFTCEMDGQEMKRLDDCVAKLKRLDTKGRLWPQEMIMEAQGGNLLLSDIESKIELESLPLRSIRQTKAILDSCAYNSLLTITVQDHGKRHPQVFMFQCEETGAEIIKGDLDKAVQRRDSDVEPRRDQSDIRSNLENIIGQHAPGSFQQTRPRPMQRESALPPLDHQPTQWGNREPVERMSPPRDYTAQEEMLRPPDLRESQSSPEVPPEQADTKRNTDILNHILGDLEIFMDKVTAAVNAPSVQKDKGKKKNAKKKKSKKTAAPADGLPSWEEYISCLQKIKYGFNLLGQLDGSLTNPSAPDFVHIFFTCLGMIVARYPADLPPTVLSPLLTEATARLLSQVVSPEEDGLWRSLGDPWNIPSSRWPGDNVPPYIPEFYDGWRPPAPSRIPSPLPYQNGPMSRSNSQRRPPDQPSRQIDESHSYSPRAMQRRPEEPVGISAWNPPPPPPTNSREPPLYMRVIYDFVARNNQELSIMKGDVVQVIQKSKQWWLVRNARNEEGNIPQNVLEPMKSARPMEDTPWETRGPVTLDMSSSPAEVKAWLQYKGFSKITVSSLGVLTGKLLLGMTKDEIRTVCPEEGGKVFFQLQAIKSAIALASEPSGQYNSRY
ncbi:putative epidermal growth factor receptor kinase substrate 8-like protein 3 [Scophthalmus maximus]|uniref:Putative epidermal growth factor receptor kinase substrate 8-like protein 3 n=1 Tax=Scophthalmus maximus TaxID=52904 RepID=A0A2U9BZ06_SCOMX|nr:epidermal growth factor receptor kinase substrate 8-like protein 3b [Scophthalmus maximus]AWP09555.1 putative epidermal growth factor receptor kinase substrate 8-like protein 3 [Scophthalmus maximus]